MKESKYKQSTWKNGNKGPGNENSCVRPDKRNNRTKHKETNEENGNSLGAKKPAHGTRMLIAPPPPSNPGYMQWEAKVH